MTLDAGTVSDTPAVADVSSGPDSTGSLPDAAPPPPDAAPPPPPPDAAPPVDTAPVSVNGLRGDYFAGPGFETFAFTRIDQLINFGWGHDAPDPRLEEDNFSIRWNGEIWPRYSERYTFHFNHDDGVRFWLDGEPLIDRWDRTGSDTQAQKDLVAGQRYQVRIEYFDKALTATMRFYWSSASQNKEIVPYTRTFTQ